MKKLLNVLCLVIILFMSFSCSKTQTSKKNIFSEEYRESVDSLFLHLESFLINNPDTILIIASEYERLFRFNKDIYSEIRLCSYLSEVCQYRLNDDLKALEFLTKAIEIITYNKEIEYIEPYLLINIGNILFSYEFYEQALMIYKDAIQLGLKNKDKDFLKLSLNNVALSFMKLEQCDSAFYYFTLADYLTPDKSSLQHAQYYLNLGTVSLVCKEYLEKIPGYFQKIRNIQKNYEKKFSNTGNIPEKEKIQYVESVAQAYRLISNYHYNRKEYEKCLEYDSLTLIYLSQMEVPQYPAFYHYRMAKLYMNLNKINQALHYAHSAYDVYSNTEDYKTISEIAEIIAEMYQKQNNIPKAYYFSQIAKENLKKHIDLQLSKQFENKKIQLAQFRLFYAYNEIQKEQSQHLAKMKQQKQLLWLLVVVLLFGIAGITYILFKREQLNKTRIQLAIRTYETISSQRPPAETNLISQPRSSDTKAKLLAEMEKMLNEQKVFLDPGLSLKSFSSKLDTNPTYLSQLINQQFDMNFNDYINKHRVNEALHILHNEYNNKMTIDHLYSKVGFCNKSTFYKAFFKFTGVSPAKYIKINIEQRKA